MAPKKEVAKVADKEAATKAVTAASILKGLPSNPDKYTVAQLTELMKRYSAVKGDMSAEEQLKIRAIGQPATKRLESEQKAAAKAAKKEDAPTVSKKALASLATEMNGVMTLQPPIDPAGDDVEARVRKELESIREDDIVAPTPEEGKAAKLVFSGAALKAIRSLGVAIPGEEAPAKAKKAKAPNMDAEKGPDSDLTKDYKARVIWAPLPESKLPPKAPAGTKLSAHVIAFRTFLAAKGKVSVQTILDACAAGGKPVSVVSVRTYLHSFMHNRTHEFPKFR